MTLTAALLFSEGIKRPIDIRRRILASVDYRKDLEDRLASGGTLNIRKALDIDDDLVELEDHSIVEGRIVSAPAITRDDGRVVPFRSILKIVPYERELQRYRVVWLDEGVLKRDLLKLQGELVVKPKSGDPVTIALSRIVDVVPAVVTR